MTIFLCIVVDYMHDVFVEIHLENEAIVLTQHIYLIT